tara:strand:+ start:210 stop:1007 length:798 start_codon:yes stop_codon:yes gene_type:complete
MTWKAKHEAHAVERMRIICEFSELVPEKVLKKACNPILDKFREFKFDTQEPAVEPPRIIQLNGAQVALEEANKTKGHVLRRTDGEDVLEEVGFRNSRFGYVTTTYGRWSATLNRLGEVFFPALEPLQDVTLLKSIKIEYWDLFEFEGNASSADTTALLSKSDPSIPDDVVKGRSTWHSHIGWFEESGGHNVLINRNLDVVDRRGADEDVIRALKLLTLVQIQSPDEGIEIGELRTVLDDLHKVSLRVVANTISENVKREIGMLEL